MHVKDEGDFDLPVGVRPPPGPNGSSGDVRWAGALVSTASQFATLASAT